MENPFVVERPVVGDGLCGRDPVLERLLEAAGRGEVGTAVGRRGAGVTSVAREMARRLAARGRRAVLVDAAGRESAAALAADALGALESSSGPGATDRGPVEARPPADPAERLAAAARALDAGDGAPLHLVLDGLGRGGGATDRSELVEAAAGTGVGLTVLRQGEPASREPGSGPEIGPIPEAAWMPYVLERFLRTDRWIANEHVRRAVEATGGRPLHAQLLFHLIWRASDPGGRVDEETLEAAHRRLLVRAGGRFRLLLDPLTGNQRRLLEALARAEPPVHPYASDFVVRHGFASPSSVQRAMGALEDAGLVQEDGEEGPRPADPVLARWLRRPRAEAIGAP